MSDTEDTVQHNQLRKNFSLWSVLGVGFGLTNSWFGISASLVAGISSGGPLLIVYGIIIVAAVAATSIGITLSELSSMIPDAGGQYTWTKELAPKKYANFLAYICGAMAWAGSVFTSASVTVAVASAIVGMYALSHDGYVPRTVDVFGCYQLCNAFIFLFNCYGRSLPTIANLSLYISLFSFLLITLVVVICSRGHYQDASFVFSEFENGTGWSSSGIAFIVGLMNPAWSFSCLDCATHMAEEVLQPERIIPIAIMGTVAIGFVTSFCYSIAMFFCIRDLETITSSTTGVPIMDIFYQALQNKAGAICLELLIVLTAIGCNVASHTWQARLCWSFSRDQGLPGSRWWSQIHPKLGVPLNAHFMSTIWCAILGCIYLASSAAFNSMLVGCITFLLISYCVPCLCLLWKGRNNVRHGPFWLGYFGLAANIVMICWSIFAVVMFSFPTVMPVSGSNMNYICVVFFIYFSYCLIYWFARGHKKFGTPPVGYLESVGDVTISSEELNNSSSNEKTEKAI